MKNKSPSSHKSNGLRTLSSKLKFDHFNFIRSDVFIAKRKNRSNPDDHVIRDSVLFRLLI